MYTIGTATTDHFVKNAILLSRLWNLYGQSLTEEFKDLNIEMY